jgi:hypothetical protein
LKKLTETSKTRVMEPPWYFFIKLITKFSKKFPKTPSWLFWGMIISYESSLMFSRIHFNIFTRVKCFGPFRSHHRWYIKFINIQMGRKLFTSHKKFRSWHLPSFFSLRWMLTCVLCGTLYAKRPLPRFTINQKWRNQKLWRRRKSWRGKS